MERGSWPEAWLRCGHSKHKPLQPSSAQNTQWSFKNWWRLFWSNMIVRNSSGLEEQSTLMWTLSLSSGPHSEHVGNVLMCLMCTEKGSQSLSDTVRIVFIKMTQSSALFQCLVPAEKNDISPICTFCLTEIWKTPEWTGFSDTQKKTENEKIVIKKMGGSHKDE